MDTTIIPPNDSYTGVYIFSKILPAQVPAQVPVPSQALNLNWNPFFPEGLSDIYAESIEMEDQKDLEREANRKLEDAMSQSNKKILELESALKALKALGVNPKPILNLMTPLPPRPLAKKPNLDQTPPQPPRPLAEKPNLDQTPLQQPHLVKKRKRQVFKTEEEVAAASALAIAWFTIINEEDN